MSNATQADFGCWAIDVYCRFIMFWNLLKSTWSHFWNHFVRFLDSYVNTLIRHPRVEKNQTNLYIFYVYFWAIFIQKQSNLDLGPWSYSELLICTKNDLYLIHILQNGGHVGIRQQISSSGIQMNLFHWFSIWLSLVPFPRPEAMIFPRRAGNATSALAAGGGEFCRRRYSGRISPRGISAAHNFPAITV